MTINRKRAARRRRHVRDKRRRAWERFREFILADDTVDRLRPRPDFYSQLTAYALENDR